MTPPDAEARRDRRLQLALFLVALALYLPAVWWGLPYATAADRLFPWGAGDEFAPMSPLAQLYAVAVNPAGRFNPQYPLFHYLVLAPVVGGYLAWLKLTGGLAAPTTAFPYGLADPVHAMRVLTLLCRLVSTCMAAGTVVAAYGTARALWNRTAALCSAVLVMLMYPMFYYGRTSNVDVPALFWTALGLYVFALVVRDADTPLTRRRAIALGALAAVATATKDPSYAVFAGAAAFVVPWHARQLRRRGAPWGGVLRPVLLAGVVAAAVYAVASGAVLRPSLWIEHAKFIQIGGIERAMGRVPATAAGYARLVATTARYVTGALGLPVALLALAGLVAAWRWSPRTLAFALPALTLWLGVVLPARFVMFRYVLVMDYVLAVFAGCALAAAYAARRPLVRRLAPAAAALAAGWALARGADVTYQMLHDTRYEAAAWLRANVRAGERLGYYGAPWKLPRLDSAVATVRAPLEPSPEVLAGVDSVAEVARPELIYLAPVKDNEPVHEFNISERVWRGLRDGSLGYRVAWTAEPKRLFQKPPVTFVNPPITILVRQDRAPR